ncbi:hypothetical protein ES703_49777 [subsurface metagenome]
MTKPKLTRQAKFRGDGSQTSVPARDSERPQLERQGDLFQNAEQADQLDRLEKSERKGGNHDDQE